MFRPDQIPPHDADAEKAMLSALFRGAVVASDVFDAVGEEALYLDAHRKLYAAARGLHDAGIVVELVAVADALKRRGHLEDVGGAAYLADVWDADPTGMNWEHHAAIVREHAGRRGIILAATVAIRDATHGVVPAADIVADLERALLATANARQRAELTPMSAAVADAISRIDERHMKGGRGDRVMTGLNALDAVLGGLRPGTLTVVAARPSVGKTSLALTLLANAAADGVVGLLVSLEMSAIDIADRYLAMAAGVPLGQIVGTTGLSPASVARLTDASMGRPSILIDSSAGHTAATIASTIRRGVLRHRVGVVCIDYLGLVGRDRGARRSDRYDLELGEMVKTFLKVGKECGIPVVLLSQLNREVEKRADGRPTLADLKNSGEIEQDADVVLLLKQEDFAKGAEVQKVTCIVAKNRQGMRGDVELDYRRPFVRFESGIPL